MSNLYPRYGSLGQSNGALVLMQNLEDILAQCNNFEQRLYALEDALSIVEYRAINDKYESRKYNLIQSTIKEKLDKEISSNLELYQKLKNTTSNTDKEEAPKEVVYELAIDADDKALKDWVASFPNEEKPVAINVKQVASLFFYLKEQKLIANFSYNALSQIACLLTGYSRQRIRKEMSASSLKEKGEYSADEALNLYNTLQTHLKDIIDLVEQDKDKIRAEYKKSQLNKK